MAQFNRRSVVFGAMSLPLTLGLAGCTGMGGGFSMTEAIRRLLSLSSQQAFATLLQPGGFYDSQIARIEPPRQFAASGGLLTQILSSTAVRTQLARSLNGFAEEGARRAAPIVTTAIQNMTITDALTIVRGGPTAATQALQGQIGDALVTAMVPEVGQAVRIASNPVVAQALRAASGIDVAGLSQYISTEANRGIWSAIGTQESAIRANPGATNDPVLMAVFGLARGIG